MRGTGGRKETGSVKQGGIGLEGVGFALRLPLLVEVAVEVTAMHKEKGVTVSRNPLELLVAGVRFELTTFGL